MPILECKHSSKLYTYRKVKAVINLQKFLFRKCTSKNNFSHHLIQIFNANNTMLTVNLKKTVPKISNHTLVCICKITFGILPLFVFTTSYT